MLPVRRWFVFHHSARCLPRMTSLGRPEYGLSGARRLRAIEDIDDTAGLLVGRQAGYVNGQILFVGVGYIDIGVRRA